MFDLRAEAEMRLYSEKLARELAGKRLRAAGGADDDTPGQPSAADREHPESAAPDAEFPAVQ
ncbi:hypothetical protein ACH4FX_31725 [Streptomyces sp. NPDC018019]|uniref:hypothetical protein n=1 Tax=Streptomyces sp. NPDC018019 TaxID=3365030 RepID=UPI0037AC1E3D